jgi:SAM-dependent methyltransferase
MSYKDIWTKAGGGEGTKFWNTVDFNHPFYKKQEQVFRGFLHGFRYIMDYGIHKGKVDSVLELGIGTGRMSKIMLEIFPNIQIYNAVDINFYPIKINNIGVYNADVTDETFFENINAFYSGRRWDFVLASEVFMHIKPEDIERVIKSVTSLLAPNGVILNIDWTSAPEHSTWCYIHDYDKLYRENGLECIFTADIPEIKQKLFCYGA